MRTIRNLIAASALLLSVPAVAQQAVPYFPQTLSSGTVVGRLSSGPGPTEEIPFAALLNALFPVGSAAFPINAASVIYQGSVNGAVTVKAQAAAGTYTLQWPNTVGANGSCFTETISGSIATGAWTPCALLGSNNTYTGINTFNGNITAAGLANFTGTFQKNSVTQTFPTSGILVGTSDAQTLTNKSIDASEINTGTVALARLPAGIMANSLNAFTADHTVASTDCQSTVLMTSNPHTVTLPSASGFPATCAVQICNGEANDISHHAVRMSGFPSPVFARLYMQQCVGVSIENGAWQATKVPGRFRPAFTPTIFIDTGGSDSNDGLVSNAAGNPIRNMNTCIIIMQTEYDFQNGIQPTCSPTAAQTFVGSIGLVGQMVGTSVINITGNGGNATLQPTAGGGSVIILGDYAVYIISVNITWDCTGGSAGCTSIFMHQQTGIDLNPTTTLKGAGAGNIGLSCDSFCKVNAGAAQVVLSGTMQFGFSGQLGSQFNITTGVALANSATVSNIFNLSASTMNYAGLLSAGTSVNVAEIFTGRMNAVYCVSGFTTSGTFTGARQWSMLNGALFVNASATVVPGSTGLSTLTNWGNGNVVNSGVSAGGC